MAALILSLRIPGEPIAQPRARAVAFGGHVRMYEAGKKHGIHDWKATLRLAAENALMGPLYDGPLRVDCTFVFSRPKRLIWKSRPMPREPHVSRPDRDNLDKAVLDALTGVLFSKDEQVCDGRIQKWIAAGDEQPHALVEVWSL